ncbi:PREDICTED: putative F-box protein At5g38270 [Camelina sativa]|uniref:F-box protein At5g38270 n=1 Tax=Camelina sativa TaxID=90675 RepID=A0ABM0TT07_CAMSA|nr:PREDICTED: putative F-box protein At5g38270 [Camelina sativa]
MDTPNDSLREKESQKVSENKDWSKLCPDLLRKIIESLSSIGYHRAKIVCSDWYNVWKTCAKRRLCPWRIIYQDKTYKLLDPGEEKIYTTQYVGLSDNTYCMASYGNWLLMVDCRLDFYIFNLLTCEKINLPSMETLIRGGAQVRFERCGESGRREWGHFVEPCRKDHVSEGIYGCKRSGAVVWINERTGDYFVAWIFKQHYVFTYKKGDDSWWNWNSNWQTGGKNLGYLDLAYKNSKLYLYTTDDHIKIIDFSGDFPKEETENNPYKDHRFYYPMIAMSEGEYIMRRRIAIEKSGEVLVILNLIKREELFFYIFKMNPESGKWKRVASIGDDEMLILDHGVTIRAPVQDVGDGIKSGSIFFVEDCDRWPHYFCYSDCGIFDIATTNIKWLKEFRERACCGSFFGGVLSISLCFAKMRVRCLEADIGAGHQRRLMLDISVGRHQAEGRQLSVPPSFRHNGYDHIAEEELVEAFTQMSLDQTSSSAMKPLLAGQGTPRSQDKTLELQETCDTSFTSKSDQDSEDQDQDIEDMDEHQETDHDTLEELQEDPYFKKQANK